MLFDILWSEEMRVFLIIMLVIIVFVLFTLFQDKEVVEIAPKNELQKLIPKKEEIRLPQVSQQAVIRKSENVIEKEEKDITEDVQKNVERMKSLQGKSFDDYYNEVTNGWDSTIANLFLSELKLDKEDLAYYFDLKTQFDNKKLEIFKSFHEKKLKEFGEDYKFDQTSDEMNYIIEELRADFHEQLRGKIGEDHFRRYQDVLADYNRDIVKKSEGRTGPRILVEI